MRRILLVDDEINIRKGLRALIERADTAFGEIGECENGREALDRLSEERFDLVVADIKMPYMDGLTLIKEAQKLAARPKFIILSGYDDFSYAKTAIKYGVNEYLLKPVDMAEMMEALNKVESELRKEESIAEGIDKANCLTNSFMEHELSYIFSSDSLSEQEIISLVKAMDVDIFDNDFSILLICCDAGGNQVKPDCRHLSLKNTVMDFMNDLQYSAQTFLDMKGNLVAAIRQTSDIDRLLVHLREKTDSGFAAGISNTGSGIRDIRKCYSQAKEALQYRIIRPLGQAIITYREIEGLKTDFPIPLDSIAKLPQMLRAFKIGEARALLEHLFDRDALCNRHISYASRLAESIYQSVVCSFMVMLPSRSDFLEKQYGCLKDFDDFKHVSEYLATLDECLTDINNCLTALRDGSARGSAIDEAIAYIHDNYHKDLNMAMVANHVSINYSYFSSLFSEQTGWNFAEYLKKVRIEKARELLSGTDFPVNVISEKVGFKNARHFARVFKELTGILPMEYRKSIFNFNSNVL